MNKSKSLLFLFFIVSKIVLANQNYYFEKISPESGFAFDAVYTITEDCNGLVWFGCNNGLYYYNTATISKVSLLPKGDGVSQSIKINHILNDNSCRLWVSTENGLFYKDPNDKHFTEKPLFNADSLYNSKYNVQKLLQFDNNLYLILIDGNLFYFDNNSNILNEVSFENMASSTNVTFIGKNTKGNLLIGTSSGHILSGEHPTDSFSSFYHTITDPIKSVCEANNKYYVGYNINGVKIIDLQGHDLNEIKAGQHEDFNLPDNQVREIIKTNSGEIWIGTYRGMLIIDQNQGKLITNEASSGLPHKSIYTIYKGKHGGLWIGTWAGGLAYYHKFNYRFKHIKRVPQELLEPQSVVSAFAQDGSGNVYIGSEQGGINLFDIPNNSFVENKEIFEAKNLNRIKSMATVDRKDIFIGTFHQGVWLFNTENNKLSKLETGELNNSAIISTMACNENELWLGTRGGGADLFKFSIEKQTVTPYKVLPELRAGDNLKAWKLFFDSAYKLWICCESGLYYKNLGEDHFQKCFQNDTIYHLNKTVIYTICEHSDGNFFLGTKGKGIFKYDHRHEQLIKISENTLLANSDVFGIVEDLDKKLWISTDNGIFSIDQETKKIAHYSGSDGLTGNQFLPNAAYATKSGKLLFGSSNGFCYIDPQTIKINTNIPSVFLSKLLINNQSFSQEKKITTNASNPAEIRNITLKHHQNSLTFGVVANNFIKPEKNRFKYRLLNYQNSWIEVDQNRDITFTKVPPGNYSFEVLASNNDGLWCESPLTVDITILAPVWKRWYALLFYFIILLLILLEISRELKLRIKLRKEILAERYKSDAKELIFSEKLKFFTNISHEIRTPLTLIISPLNNLISKFQYDQNTSKHLTIIQRNSERLLRLTNQILDFRLLEVGKLKAHFRKTDIIRICKDVFNCFELMAKEKQINFIFSSNFKSLWISADYDMIEKVVYNLVSNAIKFSNEKGQVFLSIEKKELSQTSYDNQISAGNKFFGSAIEIKVRDYGKGISKEVLPTILERFITDPANNETGTGIGLHLCQEYARLNNGNILVSSEEGKGSVFILNIPLHTNSEFEEKNIIAQFSFDDNGEENINEGLFETTRHKKVLLLAEDNVELRAYLKEFLQRYFRVLTAKNGQQAFEIANEVTPDILITDVLMPLVDGIELVRKMKNNSPTNQIPIIVLTALSENKYQKESLLEGVDSYLTKPVDESLLLAQIENILTKRELLIKQHGTFGQNKILVQANSKDLSIAERARIVVEKNLRNSDFNLEVLLQELNVSRSTLHRKIKASTNQSPTEFMRDIRLMTAVELMKNKTLNIDEIGSYVGFNSTSYFIRSFKKKYGQTPKEYYSNLPD